MRVRRTSSDGPVVAVAAEFHAQGVDVIRRGADGIVEGRTRADGRLVPAPGGVQPQVAQAEPAGAPQRVDERRGHADPRIGVGRRGRNLLLRSTNGLQVGVDALGIQRRNPAHRIQRLVHRTRLRRSGQGMPPFGLRHGIEQLRRRVFLLHSVDDVDRVQC